MRTDPDCLFCKIIAGDIPSDKVYEDETCFAFRDINPQAPTHILLVPKTHIARLEEAEAADKAVMGDLMLTAGRIAKDLGLVEDGYRTVINSGENAGQEVFHIHVHILAGRKFTWPPG